MHSAAGRQKKKKLLRGSRKKRKCARRYKKDRGKPLSGKKKREREIDRKKEGGGERGRSSRRSRKVMEVYLRLNGDAERDYAFQISETDTIRSKFARLFDRREGLSDMMVLRPSIFHKKEPRAFAKSVHPGYLTEGGGLLFVYNADDKKYLAELDEEKPLFKQLWPGQLIVPEWEWSRGSITVYTLLMLFWLYTDLPDVISPTPGNCLTNHISRMLIPVLKAVERHDLVEILQEEIAINYSGFWAQWGFFLVHILKIALITLFLYTGMGNPLSFNPYKIWKARNIDIHSAELRNLLLSLGWIGTKRATYDEYQNNFYSYTLQKYGGPGPAMRAGVIATAAAPGLPLEEGEGFQTPLEQRFTNSTFQTIKEKHKFVLSEEYFVELERNLKENLDKCNGDIGKMNIEIRRFRRFGLYECADKLKELVKLRKEVQPSKQAQPDKKTQ